MLSYNGKKIIPAPVVTLNKQYVIGNDGSRVGTKYDITLTGTLLAYYGSPSGGYADIANAFWILSGYPPNETPSVAPGDDFNNVLRKQEAIRNLFATDGASLEWQPAGGQPVVKCNPRVVNINFEPSRGQWAQGTDYTIQLEADWIYLNGSTSYEDPSLSGLLRSTGESWGFQEADGREGLEYTLTHAVTATCVIGYQSDGQKIGNKEAWQHAKDYCDGHITGSPDPIVIQSVFGLPQWLAGNYTRSYDIDEAGGVYGVNETWSVKESGTAFTQRAFAVEFSADAGDYTVRHDGTIYGFASAHRGAHSILDNAVAAIPTNQQSHDDTLAEVGGMLGGATIPVSPRTKSTTVNQIEGTVTYSFTYSTSADELYAQEFEATVGFDAEQGVYTLSLSQRIIGYGDTPAERLTNARSALLNDSAAYAKAVELAGTLLPTGAVPSAIRNKSTSINDKTANISASWSWDGTVTTNGLEFTVRTQHPQSQYATIQTIGGGDVIQNMNSTTATTVSVSITGTNQATEPASALTLAAPYFPPGVNLLIGHESSYNALRKRYDATVTRLYVQ